MKIEISRTISVYIAQTSLETIPISNTIIIYDGEKETPIKFLLDVGTKIIIDLGEFNKELKVHRKKKDYGVPYILLDGDTLYIPSSMVEFKSEDVKGIETDDLIYHLQHNSIKCSVKQYGKDVEEMVSLDNGRYNNGWFTAEMPNGADFTESYKKRQKLIEQMTKVCDFNFATIDYALKCLLKEYNITRKRAKKK